MREGEGKQEHEKSEEGDAGKKVIAMGNRHSIHEVLKNTPQDLTSKGQGSWSIYLRLPRLSVRVAFRDVKSLILGLLSKL